MNPTQVIYQGNGLAAVFHGRLGTGPNKDGVLEAFDPFAEDLAFG